MGKDVSTKRGRVVMETIDSEALRGNALGDPSARTVPIYLPPSYDEAADQRYPVVFVLTGFTGRGRMLLNDNPWSPSLDDRMDRLIAGGCGEMILVMPDCFTRLGGSQYLDSSATGRYAHHLTQELVPFVDARYRTLASRNHRGIAGKSSGGYGALIHAMRHPDLFGAAVCHSGDMAFDYCYRPDVPKVISMLEAAGGIEPWLLSFEAKLQRKNEDFMVLNLLGMAAAYSPNPAAKPLGFDLPWEPETGEFRDQVWDRWRELDPLQMVDSHADALRSLELLFVDCGTKDEWHLHLGARMLVRRLKTLGVPHEHEEFEDGHMNVSYRYDVSLPRLARALGASPAP